MKERLQQRVHELDPLPELLRTNELKLQDASERSALLEKRNAELQRNIQELNDKVSEESSVFRLIVCSHLLSCTVDKYSV